MFVTLICIFVILIGRIVIVALAVLGLIAIGKFIIDYIVGIDDDIDDDIDNRAKTESRVQ